MNTACKALKLRFAKKDIFAVISGLLERRPEDCVREDIPFGRNASSD